MVRRHAAVCWRPEPLVNSSFSLRIVPLSVCLVLAVACRDSALPPRAAAPAAPPRVSSEGQGTPFDLGEVVRRVHFAYRADGDGRMGAAAASTSTAPG